MHRRAPLLLLAALLATGQACRCGEPQDKDAGVPESDERPELVIGEFAVANAIELTDLTAFAGALGEETGKAVALEVGASIRDIVAELIDDPAAVDPTKPIRLLLLGTTPEPSWVFIGHIAPDSVARPGGPGVAVEELSGVTIVGARSSLATVAPYARHLARQPLKRDIAILYPQAVRAAARGRLSDPALQERWKRATANTRVAIVDELLGGVDRELDRVELTLEQGGKVLRLNVVAQPDGNLSRFCRLQGPAEFRLLGKLPAVDDPFLLIAGQVRAGPYFDAILRFVDTLTGASEEPEPVRAAYAEVARLFNGELAAVLAVGEGGGFPYQNFQSVLLAGTSSADGAATALVAYGEAAASAGTVAGDDGSQTFQFRAAAVEHAGVPVHERRTVTTFGKRPPPGAPKRMTTLLHSTIVDSVILFAVGAGAPPLSGETISAARGTAKALSPPPVMLRALERAGSDRASLVAVANIGALFPPGTPVPLASIAAELVFTDDGLRIDLLLRAN